MIENAGLLNNVVRHEVRTLRTLTLLGSASMSIYRRLYEQAYGPIPKDSKGRSYDIHHLDGNHSNNELSNLVALSVVDHFWEHWINGDYYACLAITQRMIIPPWQHAMLVGISTRNRVANGTHNWLKENGGSKIATERNKQRLEKGIHPFLREGLARKGGIAAAEKRATNKVACKFCEELYTVNLLGKHERACKMNPNRQKNIYKRK